MTRPLFRAAAAATWEHPLALEAYAAGNCSSTEALARGSRDRAERRLLRETTL
jgi:hypothetical protein